MTDYIETWYKDLITRTPFAIKQYSEAWGECDRHTGPSYWYAKVRILVEPSDNLQVVNKLDQDKSARLKQEGWYEQIIFGVLDVMMTYLTSPCRSFRLLILDVDFNEIDSRPIAFRLAGRDAAIKILSDYLPRT